MAGCWAMNAICAVNMRRTVSRGSVPLRRLFPAPPAGARAPNDNGIPDVVLAGKWRKMAPLRDLHGIGHVLVTLATPLVGGQLHSHADDFLLALFGAQAHARCFSDMVAANVL